MNFGKRLKELREARGLKQIEVEGVNASYGGKITAARYSKWEKGMHKPQDFDEVVAIAHFFGASIESLAGMSEGSSKASIYKPDFLPYLELAQQLYEQKIPIGKANKMVEFLKE